LYYQSNEQSIKFVGKELTWVDPFPKKKRRLNHQIKNRHY